MSAKPRMIWNDSLIAGSTTDGFTATVYRHGSTGRVMLRVKAPSGAELHQPCASVDCAKTNAETEIEHFRARARWTA